MKLFAIAKVLGGALPSQTADLEISGIASPQGAGENDITFLSKDEFRDAVVSSRCAAVIVRKGETIPGKVCIETDDPYVGYAKVACLFENTRPVFNAGIASTAIVDPVRSKNSAEPQIVLSI